jgi:hypothetical protein
MSVPGVVVEDKSAISGHGIEGGGVNVDEDEDLKIGKTHLDCQ